MLNVGQEIMLVDISTGMLGKTEAEQALEVELEAINKELDTYVCNADAQDYALAIASGIICGLFDAMYVGEAAILPGSETVKATVQNSKLHKYLAKGYASLSEILYSASDVTQRASQIPFVDFSAADNVVKAQVEDLAKQPSVMGLAVSIARCILQSIDSTNVGKRIESAGSAESTVIAAMITGFLQWSVEAAGTAFEQDEQNRLPHALNDFLLMVRERPIFARIADVSDKWYKKQTKQAKTASRRGERVSVASMLHSFMSEVANLPELKETNIGDYLEICALQQGVAPKLDPKTEAALNTQVLPVLLNEVVVRLGYCLLRVERELRLCEDCSCIDWKEVVPFNNRTVERMITISCMTFTFADAADAVVCASIESVGDALLFSQKFVARFNYVAAGRAAIAIVREAKNDQYELELLRNRRRLVGRKSAFAVERLDAYEQWLQSNLDAYLTDHLATFFEAFDIMDKGLQMGESNLVIQGNVMIQEKLGREVQFTNQKEFDDLMFSDDDLVF